MSTDTDAILVVCADESLSLALLETLHAEGLNAIGPAPTAGLALTLAAQTAPRAAIVAGETVGRRNAAELAEELARTWGVECLMLPRGLPRGEGGEAVDLRQLLTGRSGRKALH